MVRIGPTFESSHRSLWTRVLATGHHDDVACCVLLLRAVVAARDDRPNDSTEEVALRPYATAARQGLLAFVRHVPQL